MTTAAKRLYVFDRFRVDPLARVLHRDGEPVPILPKAFSTLLILLERPGEIVPKEDLIDRLWPGTTVTEASLSQCIFQVRKALGARDDGGKYVVTVPGQGYTLAAEVEVLGDEPAPVAGQPPPAAAPDPAAAAPRPHRAIVAFAAAGVVVALAVAAVLFALREKKPPAPAAARRPVVAVLGFRNLSSRAEYEWLGTALSEMLTTELAAGGRMRVIPGDVVSKTRLSLALPDADILGPDAVARFNQILGAEHLVSGSYVVLEEPGGHRLRLDVRVIEAPGGDTIASASEDGPESELFALVSRAGVRLRRGLDLGELSAEEVRSAHAGEPVSREGTRLYAEGLAALRRFDVLGARDLLLRAVDADPRSPLVAQALSRAWSTLGYDTRALEEAQRALELAEGLGREDRLLLEGRRWEAERRWDKASEAWRSLWSFFPDDLEYGLLLAGSLTKAARGAEALDVVAALRRLPPPAADDPRIDLEEAGAAQSLADHERQRRAAVAARTKAERDGARLMSTLALWYEAGALRALGQRKEALALLEKAREICAAAGDRGGVADQLGQSGLIARELGDLDRAKALYREALDITREIGFERAKSTLLTNLGVLHLYLGEPVEAEKLLEDARATCVAIGDPIGVAGVLASIVPLRASRGEFAAARTAADELLAAARKSGNRSHEASGLHNLGSMLADQGKLAEARAMFERSLAIATALGDRNKQSFVRGALAGLTLREGDPAAARAAAAAALADKKALGDRIGAAGVLNLLVVLDLEVGDVAAARAAADEQRALATQTGSQLLTRGARHNDGIVRAAAGDFAGARAALSEALATRSQFGLTLLAEGSRLELARVAVAEGRHDEAKRLAREVAAAARRFGLPDQEALARTVAGPLDGATDALAARSEDVLVRLRVGLASPDPEARARIAEEAARRGLVRIALEARCAEGAARLRAGDARGRAAIDAASAEARSRGLAGLAAACGR